MSAPSPRATRSRSLTPSDCHYYTGPNGGINALLMPLVAHYAINQNLLDPFLMVYKRD